MPAQIIQITQIMAIWTPAITLENHLNLSTLLGFVGHDDHRIIGMHFHQHCICLQPLCPRATLACLYRTSGRFYKLQLISPNSSHFTEL